jgi:hypothetical protein
MTIREDQTFPSGAGEYINAVSGSSRAEDAKRGKKPGVFRWAPNWWLRILDRPDRQGM